MADEDFPTGFGTVAIVGVGLIGGSLGMALKARRLAHRVVGIGRDTGRLDKAIALGAIDEASTELKAGIADADVVVLCTTVGHILETVGQAVEYAKLGAIVTDVGSTKGAIVARAANAPFFVGGHPMAGSERGGVEAATPTLFQEATWAITPTPATDDRAVQTVKALAQEMGATTLLLSPEAHDAMLAVTSHLPHIMASALMRLAAQTRQEHAETARLTAGSFADMTRIAASSPELWRDVCISNKDALLAALRGFHGELDALEAAVQSANAADVEAFFAAGAAAKRDWNAQ